MNSDIEQRAIVDTYDVEALRRFEQATEADYAPGLALLDALVRSLEIAAPVAPARQ